jgi:hypothetical protein
LEDLRGSRQEYKKKTQEGEKKNKGRRQEGHWKERGRRQEDDGGWT